MELRKLSAGMEALFRPLERAIRAAQDYRDAMEPGTPRAAAFKAQLQELDRWSDILFTDERFEGRLRLIRR